MADHACTHGRITLTIKQNGYVPYLRSQVQACRELAPACMSALNPFTVPCLQQGWCLPGCEDFHMLVGTVTLMPDLTPCVQVSIWQCVSL